MILMLGAAQMTNPLFRDQPYATALTLNGRHAATRYFATRDQANESAHLDIRRGFADHVQVYYGMRAIDAFRMERRESTCETCKNGCDCDGAAGDLACGHYACWGRDVAVQDCPGADAERRHAVLVAPSLSHHAVPVVTR